ncbi:MAG: L-threonylcarbamoyladenylate synthase [Balneolaceae bacterium]
MTQRIKLHPETPHRKRIFEISDVLREDGVILLPTDSQYALACDYRSKGAMERIRQIRRLDKNDHLTVLCESLQHASVFARMDDPSFKLVKRLTPGPYTFILPATREVPRLLVHPRKKTVGIRVPDYPICQELIGHLGTPLIAISARREEVEHGTPEHGDRELFLSRFDGLVDLVIDNQQPLPDLETTIVDLTTSPPELLREGPGMAALADALAMEMQVVI